MKKSSRPANSVPKKPGKPASQNNARLIPKMVGSHQPSYEYIEGRLCVVIRQVPETLDTTGRMDSFTKACDTLAKAEHAFGFPFAKESDHLFCYVKASQDEPSKLDGYALMILYKQLHVCGGHFVEGGKIAPDEISPIYASDLLDYLYESRSRLKEDTVLEQMRWVQDAQEYGLLAPDYPTFRIGFDKDGNYIAFPEGEPLPDGCKLYPGQ